MATPIPKTSELLGTLTTYIDAGESASEWDLALIRREIDRIDEPVAKAMLTALCFGAAKKESHAIEAFEDAIRRFRDSTVALNYSTYLKHIKLFTEYSKVSYRLAEEFDIPELVDNAYDAALISADLEKIAFFSRRLLKYYPEEREGEIMARANLVADSLCQIEKDIGVNSREINEISERCISIASKYRRQIVCSGVYHIDSQVDVIFYVNEDDPDVLADMNLDLAMSLAESEKLITLPVTAWFRHRMPVEDEVPSVC